MKIVFAGPSLAGTRLPRRDDIVFRPPVRQGELFLATLDGPSAIGVIDGVFDGVPSVWHKEILWALSIGIPVYGSSSMGALRAAELDGFGMVGVGAIYEAYRDGTLEDDDEVALQHGPAEAGYVPLSLPMVNVRATVAAAMDAGIVDATDGQRIEAAAKAVFFKQRSWDRVFEAAAAGLGDDPAALHRWFRDNTVDQKMADALQLLERLGDAMPAGAASFDFEHTEMWEQGVAQWQRGGVAVKDGNRKRGAPERLFDWIGER
jgi:hypothetical protein